MGFLFAHREFPELELSAQPAERKAQVRVLEKVLSAIEGRHREGRIMSWSALARFAESPAVVEATAAHLEAHRVRIGLDDEIKRLTALLSQAGEAHERMRREHAEAMAARDQDLRQAEERHALQERRMLAEVDRARQTAKALESELAREQQRRTKSEEAAAKRLEGELERLHQVREAARQAEVGLREQLAAQGIDLAQVRTKIEALAASVVALEGRIDDEKAAHEKTRQMLAEALTSKSAAKGDASTRRRRKS